MGGSAEAEDGNPAGTGGDRRRAWVKPVLAAAALLSAFVLVSVFLPVGRYLGGFLRWAEGLGAWGPVLVVAVYVVACIFLVPGSVITLGAGAVFGLVTGTVAVSIGSTLGACAAFLAGRTLARDWVARRVAGNAKFEAIDRAVGKEGLKIVFLTRLSPIFPFNLQNYAYGLTRVPLWKYALASWVGMLPGTVMYVYIGGVMGDLARIAAGEVERTAGQRVFFWVGLAVTVAVVVFVTRLARKAIRQAAPGGA